MSPANPEDVKNRVVISEGYHGREKATVDFYTNSSIAIYRGDEDKTGASQRRVWLDNLEKRELLRVLREELE